MVIQSTPANLMKIVRNIQLANYNNLTATQKDFVQEFEDCRTGGIYAEAGKTSVDVLNELAAALDMKAVVLDFSTMTPSDFKVENGIVPVWAAAAKAQPSIIMFVVPDADADRAHFDAMMNAWVAFLGDGMLLGTLLGGGRYDVTGKSMFGVACPAKVIKAVASVAPVVKEAEPVAPAFVHSNPNFKLFIAPGKLFNTIVCTRCHGCGEHQYNMRSGRVCFGCNGTGKMWARADKNMVAVYSAALKDCRSTEASNVKVGDVISLNSKWEEVSTIEQVDEHLAFGYLSTETGYAKPNQTVRRMRTLDMVLNGIADLKMRKKIETRIAEYTAVIA